MFQHKLPEFSSLAPASLLDLDGPEYLPGLQFFGKENHPVAGPGQMRVVEDVTNIRRVLASDAARKLQDGDR